MKRLSRSARIAFVVAALALVALGANLTIGSGAAASSPSEKRAAIEKEMFELLKEYEGKAPTPAQAEREARLHSELAYVVHWQDALLRKEEEVKSNLASTHLFGPVSKLYQELYLTQNPR
jgi:hypothetical protein